MGEQATLIPSFPCVTCPVQANMTTGKLPSQHGVVANGFYWRDKQKVEMWTAWNDCILTPQIWDILGQHNENLKTAVWFPLHSKGCNADFICTPAPIHNPDGSESLWCYTRPTEMYGQLRDRARGFSAEAFLGAAGEYQKHGVDCRFGDYCVRGRSGPIFSTSICRIWITRRRSLGRIAREAKKSLAELDEQIGKLAGGFAEAYASRMKSRGLVASEYAIVPVDHVLYPNRMLREAGLLKVREEADGEHLDFAASRAWALVDHQFSHVFVQPGDDAGDRGSAAVV